MNTLAVHFHEQAFARKNFSMKHNRDSGIIKHVGRALTGLTAGAAGRACVHTGGAGVVAQVALPAGLVLPLGAVGHAAALVQSPASRTATPTETAVSSHQSITQEKRVKVVFLLHRARQTAASVDTKARRKTRAIGLHQSGLMDSPPNNFFRLNGSFCLARRHQR